MDASQRSGRRKSGPKQPSFQSTNGSETHLRPEIDVILSLKDSVYKSVMIRCFQKLGGKNNASTAASNDEEKETAREALQLFQKRSGGSGTRFFKPQTRYASNLYVEVDEAAALEKITADIYRRMESAKKWMKSEDLSDDENHSRKSPPLRQAPPEISQKEIPTQQASTLPPPKSTSKNKTRRPFKKVPESLPFIKKTSVAEIIMEEEQRARKKADASKARSPNDQSWQPDEVNNFFRGLYVHGWSEWKKISNMVKTRSSQHVKTYAYKLEKKAPELKKFFTQQHGAKVKQTGYGGTRELVGGIAHRTARPQNDPAIVAGKHPTLKRLTKPKVVICLGDHIIDTEAEPNLIQPSSNRKRPADTLPDYFDPSVRPSVPTNSRQIYVPGNKVYARWLNRDDPGSFGTWYPGFVHASKIAPIQDSYNDTGVPSLLYHVKFDDGAESLDLDTEDIMMHDQYQAWLKDLEQYYSLSVSEEVTWKRLTRNTRVYGKWIDPTDPEVHGSWMPGKVHDSKTWEGNSNQWHHSYHIYFDNEDQDENLQDGDVIEEETYVALLREKMERGRKKSRLSGFDLITEASKISSPIKIRRNDTGPNHHNGTLIDSSAKKKLYAEDSNVSDDEPLMEELMCNEVLEPRPPSPTHVARLSSTPSPDVHYGIYTKAKPWQLAFYKNASSVSQGQQKIPTSSEEPKKSCGVDSDYGNQNTQDGKVAGEDLSPHQSSEAKAPPSQSSSGDSKECVLNSGKAKMEHSDPIPTKEPNNTEPVENACTPEGAISEATATVTTEKSTNSISQLDVSSMQNATVTEKEPPIGQPSTSHTPLA